jgi:hypothetical protein
VGQPPHSELLIPSQIVLPQILFHLYPVRPPVMLSEEPVR